MVVASESTSDRVRDLAGEVGLDVKVLPLRSVGVQGDGRTYAHPALLSRANDKIEVIPDSGRGSPVTWETLEQLSSELTNTVSEINRVIIQLGPERPLDQHLKEGYLTRERLNVLREADAVAMEELERYGLMTEVTQMPTVLVPLSSDGTQESVVLRPVSTDDFMPASVSLLPSAFLERVTERLMVIDGIEAVYYDITHKPPGTVEWE